MAYIGKEYKFDREENFEELIKVLASSEDRALTYLTFKPNTSLVKNGDEYTIVFSVPEKGFKKEASFKHGVEFDEVLQGSIPAKSIVNVDGDTFTQVQDFGKGKVTIKREFTPTELKVTVTSTLWDATAYRYYTA